MGDGISSVKADLNFDFFSLAFFVFSPSFKTESIDLLSSILASCICFSSSINRETFWP